MSEPERPLDDTHWEGNTNWEDNASLDNVDVDELVQWIREAGDYVVPTPDLRPRVLEVARQVYNEHKQTWRVGLLAVAAMALWITLQPLTSWTTKAQAKWLSPSADELHSIASKIAAQTGCGSEWGLVEAFHSNRFTTDSQAK